MQQSQNDTAFFFIKNLEFAMLVEPDNEKVKEMLSWARVRKCYEKGLKPQKHKCCFDEIYISKGQSPVHH